MFPQHVHRGQLMFRGKLGDPSPQQNEHGVREDEEGTDPLPAHARECALDIFRPLCLHRLKLESQRPRGAFRLVKEERGGAIDRIPEHGHPTDARNDLLQQLQLFADDLGGDQRQTGDVPARSGEAGGASTTRGTVIRGYFCSSPSVCSLRLVPLRG
jgi:hypothetical protein